MNLDRRSRSGLPSLWAILFLAGCCILSTVIAFRARAAQTPTEAPAAATAQGTAAPDKDAPSKDPADKSAEKPADKPSTDKGTSETTGSKRAPPSKAEASATIEDDPTLVPDDKESADNNVTFPIDI